MAYSQTCVEMLQTSQLGLKCSYLKKISFKKCILERVNVFISMLMRKEYICLKFRGQSTKLNDNIHTPGKRVTNTFYLRWGN